MKFGENLKKLRKLKKLSQENLAEKMQVSRQSISKWETGDAYPEMNHIIELCKIFHCHINDLVNDRIIDADALDEDIKRNVVKFKKEQQDKMKILSKTIAIIARISKILVLICIPVIILSMIILGVIINKVEIANNTIKIENTKEQIRIEEINDTLSIKINNKTIADTKDKAEIMKLKEILEKNSKQKLFWYIEVGFIFLILCLILVSIMLKSLENLFKNINKGDTPFTLENVNYIKKIAYLMIAITIFPNIVGILFETILDMDLDIGFELFSLVEILFLFSIAYVFQYGYEIQLDSKGKMYSEE